ncbi:MAG: FAD-binding oxidoreductase [Granulosicoccus sp.]|nr:FAD-binding oxidoreductase [Granulosicoccus sp.]
MKKLPDSLWAATAPQGPSTEALAANTSVDVAVIGAGFTGLRAALCLAEAGKRVTVVDAGDIGWGASGRNGGQVNPIGHETPQSIAKHWQGSHDPAHADRFTRCVIDSADELFGLVRRHQIECDAQQNGWIRAVHGNSAKAHFNAMCEGWSAAGAELSQIDAQRVRELSGCHGYGSGWICPRGGSVQPLAYARGLAQAAIEAGAVIHTHTVVNELQRMQDNWLLRTPQADLKADQIILATNGYTDQLCSGLQKSIVPVVSIQAATEPLSDEQVNTILPGRHTFADTRRVIYYFRKTAQNRLVFGSAGFSDEVPGPSDVQRIRQGLSRVYPMLDKIRIDFIWGGRIAVTQDHLPHIHQPSEGLWSGLGFNGRGVAMSTVMGRLLAELALGSLPDAMPIPVSQIKSYPFHRFHRLGSKAVLHWSEWLDRRESRNSS